MRVAFSIGQVPYGCSRKQAIPGFRLTIGISAPERTTRGVEFGLLPLEYRRMDRNPPRKQSARLPKVDT